MNIDNMKFSYSPELDSKKFSRELKYLKERMIVKFLDSTCCDNKTLEKCQEYYDNIGIVKNYYSRASKKFNYQLESEREIISGNIGKHNQQFDTSVLSNVAIDAILINKQLKEYYDCLLSKKNFKEYVLQNLMPKSGNKGTIEKEDKIIYCLLDIANNLLEFHENNKISADNNKIVDSVFSGVKNIAPLSTYTNEYNQEIADINGLEKIDDKDYKKLEQINISLNNKNNKYEDNNLLSR